MTPDEDGSRADDEALRRLFREVPVPVGMERWRTRVPVTAQAAAGPATIRRRLAPVLVASVTITVLIAVALVATLRPAGPVPVTGGPSVSPAASAGPSGGPTGGPTGGAAPASPGSTHPVSGGPHTPTAAWPSATTAGVPAGTRLTTHAGDLHLDTAGQTVTGLLVDGTVVVSAPNVTIRRTRILGAGYFGVRQLAGGTNLVIEDSEVSGSAGVQYGIEQEATGLTVRRTHVHGVQQGIEAGSQATIVDSLVDGLTPSGSATGVASRGGTGLTVRHSVVLNPAGTGTAVAIYADNGPQSGAVVDSCLLGGGGYTLHVGAGATGVTVTGNQFSTAIWPHAGDQGPVRWDAAPPGSSWTGNTWQGTGLALGPPA